MKEVKQTRPRCNPASVLVVESQLGWGQTARLPKPQSALVCEKEQGVLEDADAEDAKTSRRPAKMKQIGEGQKGVVAG